MLALILAGGLGTRLRSVLSHLPKAMAPISGKPFLAYLLNELKKQGIEEVILATGYLHEKIHDYFIAHEPGLPIQWICETQPLGTGGAIVHALSQLKNEQPLFIINGDTFVRFSYRTMYQQHCNEQADLTIALRHVANCERFGRIEISPENKILAFKEKTHKGAGLINAGVYLLKPSLLNNYCLPKCFSFEEDFIARYLTEIHSQAYIADDYFIDIGLPEDYQRAQIELPQLLGQ